MHKKYNIVLLLIMTIAIGGCIVSTEPTKSSKKHTIFYAKKFNKIIVSDSITKLEIYGNKTSDKVTATFVLYSKSKPKPLPNQYLIQVPVKSIISLSSIYTEMLLQLQVNINQIKAIDNVTYYNNKQIIEAVNTHKMLEVAKSTKLDIEKILLLNPNVLFTFGMGNPKEDVDKRLAVTAIPIAISLDHLEETPLARYEWLKFFAAFVCKDALADSLFGLTEHSYKALQKLTPQVVNKKSVLTEIKYGSVWYVPAGNSYIANLINDAGGKYFWNAKKQTGSIPLSFENVFNKAKDADVWINLYSVNNKQELLSYDSRYAFFKAFKTNQLYNNNKIQNAQGFSNYWEKGINKPDSVLADLIYILYPELLPNHQLMFYKKIN